MPRPTDSFQFDPPSPLKAHPAEPFTQTIRLLKENQQRGQAVWHHAGSAAIPGVVQVINITVIDPGDRRQGAGKALLDAAIESARKHLQAIGQPLRHVWVSLPHTQTIARAFLTKTGFHHVSGMKNLHSDQEMLIYVRSLD